MNRQRLFILFIAGIVSLIALSALGLAALGRGRAEEGPPILQYPPLPPTPTLAPPPADSPQPAGATTLFADSFAKDGAPAGWQIVDLGQVLDENRAVWVVKDGRLHQNFAGAARSASFHETLAVTGDAKWADYTISTKVYDEFNQTFGLVARRQGNSFYRYRIVSNVYDEKPKQILEKVVNGVATPLATHDSPGFEPRRWYTVSMSVTGSQIQVWLDGKLVAEATDSALTSGQAGIYTRAFGGIFFDDVTITAP